MNRKQFVKISGRSFLGLAFLSHLPVKSIAKLFDHNKSGNGGAMIEVKTKRLFLQDTWTISRNSSDYKDNVFVKIEKDGVAGYGEAAPNVRYGEDHQKTTDRINAVKGIFEEIDIDRRIGDCLCAVHDLGRLRCPLCGAGQGHRTD